MGKAARDSTRRQQEEIGKKIDEIHAAMARMSESKRTAVDRLQLWIVLAAGILTLAMTAATALPTIVESWRNLDTPRRDAQINVDHAEADATPEFIQVNNFERKYTLTLRVSLKMHLVGYAGRHVAVKYSWECGNPSIALQSQNSTPFAREVDAVDRGYSTELLVSKLTVTSSQARLIKSCTLAAQVTDETEIDPATRGRGNGTVERYFQYELVVAFPAQGPTITDRGGSG